MIAPCDPCSVPVASAPVGLRVRPELGSHCGTLHGSGAMTEAFNATPDAWQERSRQGVQPGMILSGEGAPGPVPFRGARHGL